MDWMKDYGLIDATLELDHTFHSSMYSALIDRILVSCDIIESKEYNGTSDLSDHNPVAITWDEKQATLWKLNQGLLTDSWVEGMKGVLADFWSTPGDPDDKWESLKQITKDVAISTGYIQQVMYRANVVQLESKISVLLSEGKTTNACIAQAQLEELKFNRAKIQLEGSSRSYHIKAIVFIKQTSKLSGPK